MQQQVIENKSAKITHIFQGADESLCILIDDNNNNPKPDTDHTSRYPCNGGAVAELQKYTNYTHIRVCIEPTNTLAHFTILGGSQKNTRTTATTTKQRAEMKTDGR